MGWAKEQVVIIDEDLGLSGSSTDKRSGFACLTNEGALAHAGIVFDATDSGCRIPAQSRGIDALTQLCREKLDADPSSGYLFQCPFDCTSGKPRLAASSDYPSLSSPAGKKFDLVEHCRSRRFIGP
jgi:hypothetical protein